MLDSNPSINMPKFLYHFTSLNGLTAILRAGHIALSESNLNIREGNCGVVWLTSSPDSNNHGLEISDTLPAAYNKTKVRIALPITIPTNNGLNGAVVKEWKKLQRYSHCYCRSRGKL